MEGSGGDLCKLGRSADARVEQQAAVLAADGWDAGEVGEGKPFVDVLDVDLKLSSQVLALDRGFGRAEELLGRFDAASGELLLVLAAESGKLGDRPIHGAVL
jgi:hypothetical protein